MVVQDVWGRHPVCCVSTEMLAISIHSHHWLLNKETDLCGSAYGFDKDDCSIPCGHASLRWNLHGEVRPNTDCIATL